MRRGHSVAGGRRPSAYGAPSLHDLFKQQARAMLDRIDLDQEHKQSSSPP